MNYNISDFGMTYQTTFNQISCSMFMLFSKALWEALKHFCKNKNKHSKTDTALRHIGTYSRFQLIQQGVSTTVTVTTAWASIYKQDSVETWSSFLFLVYFRLPAIRPRIRRPLAGPQSKQLGGLRIAPDRETNPPPLQWVRRRSRISKRSWRCSSRTCARFASSSAISSRRARTCSTRKCEPFTSRRITERNHN